MTRTDTPPPGVSPPPGLTEEVRTFLLTEWERALPNQQPMGEALLSRYTNHYE